jgi:hypothetical protein
MTSTQTTPLSIQQWVDGGHWPAITAELDQHGCALTPQLLSAHETARIAALYDVDQHFRSTIEMARSSRGWSAAPLRHGVSTIRSGQRFALGLVFHDAA